ncbi:MAG: guanylate kinase [bacterium]|nr:guanylate kinase [bacterium]
MSDSEMNNLIVISGPSGSGKSTLIRRLLKKHPETIFSTSHTTRAIRPREVNGRDYHFVSKKIFLEMVENDEFVEWAQVYGNYYGTSFREIEFKAKMDKKRFLVLDIDVQGARNIRKKYPDALFVFVVPPSMGELRRRLLGREKKMDEQVRKRLEIAYQELKQYDIYDYIIINEYLDKSSRILDAIYTAFRNTVERHIPFIKKLLAGGKE